MTLAQLIDVIRARWGMVAVTTILLLVVALSYSLLAQKTYVAETSLVVNAGELNAVTGAAQYVPTQTSFIATQADIIASHGVALKVVDRLGLANDVTLQRAFNEATRGIGSLKDWIADQLVKFLNVKQARESNVLTIAMSSTSPVDAANWANAFAEAYIDKSIAIKAENATKQSRWLQKQVDTQRAELKLAQDRLSEYQRTANIPEADNRMDVESVRLNELAGQLVQAQAARSDAESRLGQMKQALTSGKQDGIAELSTNPVVQSLKAELNRAEAGLAEATSRYGSKHPQYLAAVSEVEKLQSRLHAELVTAQGGIQQAAEQAARRETEISAALERQRTRILSLKQLNDQRDVLTRDVESAQRAYEIALQRANQMSMESKLDQSSIAILSAAVVPPFPSSPKLVLNVALSIVLGGLLGLGLALLMELKDRRVRSAFDLADLGLPVLSEVACLNSRTLGNRLPWRRAPRLLFNPNRSQRI
ncbi:MAG: chain length determinant protein EpsF [Steroidobacteraceae bacterium]